jgi:hypothetical protein
MGIDVLYSEIKEFSNLLAKENFIRDAEKLLDCMESGCTGTEILMCLKFNIKNIVNSKDTSQKIKDISENLLKKINHFIGDTH